MFFRPHPESDKLPLNRWRGCYRELQWPEADVHNFNDVDAALADGRVKHSRAVRSIHSLQGHARRIDQHELERNIQTRLCHYRDLLRTRRPRVIRASRL